MEAGGTLTIRTYLQDAQIVLEINDQGKGISKDIQDKIGTPFVTDKENGTGLGLAVCYSIAPGTMLPSLLTPVQKEPLLYPL